MTSRQYQTQEPPEKLELPDLLEHLKYAYFFEHQRREEIEKRIQAPVTILVGLIGGFFALTFQSLKYWHPGAVGALFLLNLVFLSITAFYFGRFMWPRNYLYVRLPLELLNQYRDIIDPPKPKEDSEWKEENPDSIQLTRENFTDYLMEYYAHPTSHNRDVNMKRSDDYAMGWRFLFFTLAIEGAWVVLYLALAILSS